MLESLFFPRAVAVIGASTKELHIGNRVVKNLLDFGFKGPVYPINPKADEVEGLQAYASLAALPKPVRGISVITPPQVTEDIVEQAIVSGVKNIWMQPGAESKAAVAAAQAAGLNVIADGSCLLVVLGYREH